MQNISHCTWNLFSLITVSWKDEYDYRITWLSVARVVSVRKRREGNLGARPSTKEKGGEELVRLPPSWRPFVLPTCPHLLSFPSGTMRKQSTFADATTGFPAKWRLRNERRNSIMMTRHYPDQGSACDWSCRVGNLIQLIRSTTQICTRHQYGISALVCQTSFGGETSGSVAKCRLFS